MRSRGPHEQPGRGFLADRLLGAVELDAELARRGVTLLNGPMDRPWGVRTASFVDPGGHIWEIAK